MSTSRWTLESIPDQNGKLALITGATGGLGFEVALALAKKGATVIIIGRSETKSAMTLNKIKSTCPKAKATFEKVDLMSLAAISEFAHRFNSQNPVLDILVNNAGIAAVPKRETTEDGFEKQFATNHLAHFALTALLLPALKRSAHARVVNVSSIAHWWGKINFDNLQFEKGYKPWDAYSQSKLANLLFTLELQKKSDEGKWGLHCISAHPGYSRTDILHPDEWNIFAKLYYGIMERLLSQSAAEGALPILYAATSLDATDGGYYGPDGFYELYGYTKSVYLTPDAKDENLAAKLWEVSTSLTGAMWV